MIGIGWSFTCKVRRRLSRGFAVRPGGSRAAVLRERCLPTIWRGCAASPRYAPIKIVDPPEQLRIVRIDSIGGRDVYAAEIVVDPATTRTYYFDVASGLLVRESATTATAFIPLQEQVDYEDYRSVDRIMLPFVVRTADDAPYDTSIRTFTNIRHGVALDDAIFAVPDTPRR